MCGLIGAVGEGADEVVEQGLRMMEHRGIRSKIISGRDWAMGHVRLPIVGLDESNDQPVQTYPLTLAFVGEVLDVREHEGCECDVPVVGDAWFNRGPYGLIDRDGFWSVVVHDYRDGSLSCLVDYLAQKPLYIRTIEKRTSIVCSEIDPLVCAPGYTPPRLDRTYLSACVKWGYCPDGTRTPYEGVSKIPPGTCVKMDRFGLMSTELVDPVIPSYGSHGEFKEILVASVRRRAQFSDVPVACLVSGGLDSSIVYTVASRYADVVPYHVENDELEFARTVCPGVVQTPSSDVDPIRAMKMMQEPIDLGSLVPQVSLSESVIERVCLTGDGADELLGGYGRAERYDSQYSDVFHELVSWHLPRLDRIMMKNRIEVRSPFLSRGVVQMALGLPRSDRTGKSILKNLFRGEVPDAIIDRPKRPLRTREVESNREIYSRMLVEEFISEYEQRCRR